MVRPNDNRMSSTRTVNIASLDVLVNSGVLDVWPLHYNRFTGRLDSNQRPLFVRKITESRSTQRVKLSGTDVLMRAGTFQIQSLMLTDDASTRT